MSALERLWLMLHRALLLLAGVGGQSIDADVISHGKARGGAPAGGEEVRKLERRWQKCLTDDDRRDVLRDAIELWRAHTLPNADYRATRGTREWREAIARDPRSSRDVAKIYGISFKTVCNYRAEFGHPSAV